MKKFFALSILLISGLFIQAQIIHVPGDQPTIQEGINAAANGDTVLVADGLYYENIFFMGKAITVASHYIMNHDISHIQNTIIDGSQPDDPDYGTVVSFVWGEDTTSILCGFTITGGSGTYFVDPVVGEMRYGGGIALFNSGAKIIHNYIEYNIMSYNGLVDGGGLSAGDLNSDSWVILTGNKIRYNELWGYTTPDFEYGIGGGGVSIYCNAIIKDNEISHNVVYSEYTLAVGGGILISAPDGSSHDATISNNLITLNRAFSDGTEWAAFGGGIRLQGPISGTISDNIISWNELQSPYLCAGAGMILTKADTTLVAENNIIFHNYSLDGEAWGGGLIINWGSAKVTGNLIYKNQATYGGGIYVMLSTECSIITNNTIVADTADGNGGGIFIRDDGCAQVLNTIVWDNVASNDPEIYVDNGSLSVDYSDVPGGWEGEGNIDTSPSFADAETDNYTLWDDSPCIDSGDPSLYDPDGTRSDMGYYPYFQGTRIIVKQDGTGHFTTIQDAIDASGEGDTVVVYGGTYYENINFRGRAITVASRYLETGDENHVTSTVINGSMPADPEKASVVTFESGEDNNSVLEGFTITGGLGTIVNTPVGPYMIGGGVNCIMSGPTILHNRIMDNQILFANGVGYGGGICTGPPGTPAYHWIEDNLIENNSINSLAFSTGGGIYLLGNGRIVDNQILNNTCFAESNQCHAGGVMCASGTNLLVSGNTIEGNEANTLNNSFFSNWGGIAGGLALFMCTSGEVRDNVIRDNHVTAAEGDSATAPGLMIEQCSNALEFNNNVVANNTYSGGECFGGGISVWYGEANIFNNFIFSNTAKYGAGISVIDTLQMEHNSLIYNNTFTGNIADSLGGALYVELWPDYIPGNMFDSLFMMNNILWDDQAMESDEIHLVRGDLMVVYSNVMGGWEGEGNIDLDPLFDSDDDTLYHITGSSPCLDAGTLSFDFNGMVLISPAYDFDGNARPDPVCNGVDIGADELNCVGIMEPIHENEFGVSVYPNPTDDNADFRFRINEEGQVTLKIYDVHGIEVATLLDEHFAPGEYQVRFDASQLAPGAYFCRITAGAQSCTGKLIIIN